MPWRRAIALPWLGFSGLSGWSVPDTVPGAAVLLRSCSRCALLFLDDSIDSTIQRGNPIRAGIHMQFPANPHTVPRLALLYVTTAARSQIIEPLSSSLPSLKARPPAGFFFSGKGWRAYGCMASFKPLGLNGCLGRFLFQLVDYWKLSSLRNVDFSRFLYLKR